VETDVSSSECGQGKPTSGPGALEALASASIRFCRPWVSQHGKSSSIRAHANVSRCGNGLLTHILVTEGYKGHGIDVRARTSWFHYTDATQNSLHVVALDPTTLGQSKLQDSYLVPGVFLIGNHADELTPWVPVISTLCLASGYLSIPCCAWTFDSRFERSRSVPYPTGMDDDEFVESLYLGGDGSNSSSYSQYRIWLGSLSVHCGWKVECETLRIPSTRNWALIGACCVRGGCIGRF
jgi:tRNASer (uridine44-2'-O)-methyltransferase